MQGLDLQKHFSLNSSMDVDAICSSALNSIGITYFNYLKIYNYDGSRELLTNNSAWIDHFYRNALYNSIAAIDVEHLLPKGYFLWSELEIDDPVYAQGRESFNIDNGISFVIKRKDVTYLYIFASTRDNYKINNFYVRNIDLFKRFILYFNDKASSLMKEAAKNRIFLPEKQLILPDRLQEINLSNLDREKFYKTTDIEKYYLLSETDDLYLTRKQAECAAYMVAGATAKQCARELNISFRTVEEHLLDIKNKIYDATGKKLIKEEMIDFLKKAGIHDVIFPNEINLYPKGK